MSTPQIIQFDQGRAESVDAAAASLPETGFLWIHQHTGQGRDWAAIIHRITGITVFDDHLSDTENPAHPPYFHSTSNYEVLILRALRQPVTGASDPKLALSADSMQTQAIVCLLFDRCLVTIAPSDTAPLDALRMRLLEPAAQRLPASASELFLRFAAQIGDQYLALRQPLNDQMEQWQTRLLEPSRAAFDWPRLLNTRLALQRLGIVCEAQSDALSNWLDERLEAEPLALDERLQVRARDVLEHLQRVIVLSSRIETSIESAVQLHFSATAHRTNEIMRLLTVLTAIFLPLTLITGIFGMNFQQMPGLGNPAGFWLTMAVMALIAAVLGVLFRKRRFLEWGRRRS